MDKKKNIIIISIILVLLVIICTLLFTRSKEYSVTFDAKGGTYVGSQIVKKGNTVQEPETPTKEDYIFLGWYTNEDSNEEFDFKTKVSGNITLIAKWKKNDISKITGITIDAEKTELVVGETLNLMAKIQPNNIKDLNIEWKSSDESVAKVDETGKVTTLKAGTVKITVKVEDVISEVELVIKDVEKDNTTTVNNKPTTKPQQNPVKNQPEKPVEKPEQPTQTPEEQPSQEPEKEPEEAITYSYEWVKAETSVAGQYYLYIKSSKGEYVSGTATLTTKAGTTKTVSIPASGSLYVKDAITQVSNVKGN